MKSLLLLRNVRVENANAIAGFTHGFPAITHFLGFTHALSRKLTDSHGLQLGGCAVICHQHDEQSYKPQPWSDRVFALTRNPLTKKGDTSPIVEEGRMHLRVSMLLECQFDEEEFEEPEEEFANRIFELTLQLRLAGGAITTIQSVQFFDESKLNTEKAQRHLLRLLLPGFALVERSTVLAQHIQTLAEENIKDALSAWLDFAALRSQWIPESIEAPENGEWQPLPKPNPGWLVPLMIGYRRVSELFDPGSVVNVRDTETPFCFVEPIHSVGEWLNPLRATTFEQLLWRYNAEPETGWYLCRNFFDAKTVL